MALPYDAGKAFLRVPPKYAHDGFGHDGSDGCGRTMPHTGRDVTPIPSGSTSGRVLSVWGGEVVEAGFDKEAGWYVILRENDGAWWGYGHNSRNVVPVGQRVAPGGHIAYFGNSGGAKGVHCHIWRATNLAAARRVVHGLVNYRNGRTVAQWAESMGGLTDPFPWIQKSLAERPKPPTEKAAEQIEEEELMGAKEDIIAAVNADVSRHFDVLTSRMRREARPEVYYVREDADGTYDAATAPFAAAVHPASGFIFPLVAPDRSGQLASLAANYRLTAHDSVPQGFTERAFWNGIKDVLIGSGRLPVDTGEADGVVAARALFAHVSQAVEAAGQAAA